VKKDCGMCYLDCGEGNCLRNYRRRIVWHGGGVDRNVSLHL
jgi:hypothetical protein